jgi:hypothetical protein
MSRTLAGASDVVASVIEGAGVLIESMLSAPLHRRKVLDYFNDPAKNREGSLDLSGMFIDIEAEPKLYFSSSELMPPETGDPVEEKSYYLWLDENTVVLSAYILNRYNRYCFEYESGFTEVGGLAQGVPTWLREVVISGALYVLQTQVISHQKSIEQRDYSAILKQHLHRLVASRVRPVTGRNWPTFSVPTDH